MTFSRYVALAEKDSQSVLDDTPSPVYQLFRVYIVLRGYLQCPAVLAPDWSWNRCQRTPSPPTDTSPGMPTIIPPT